MRRTLRQSHCPPHFCIMFEFYYFLILTIFLFCSLLLSFAFFCFSRPHLQPPNLLNLQGKSLNITQRAQEMSRCFISVCAKQSRYSRPRQRSIRSLLSTVHLRRALPIGAFTVFVASWANRIKFKFIKLKSRNV